MSFPSSSNSPNTGARPDIRIVRILVPYLWPKNSLNMRVRVAVALSCLGLAKLATVTVPFFYKGAVDLVSSGVDFLLTALVALVIGYGVARASQQIFAELREFLFARVAQRAIRAVALKTFRHVHSLSLRYHLDRQTGGLSRAIERGTKGIEFLLSFLLFHILPTILEIVMVCGILWYWFDFWYAAVTFATITCYIIFTMLVTNWRIKVRRRMNEMDSEANTKAIDSLLNFETVKYFNNEAHEADRYDESLKNYEEAAVRNRTSLSTLNMGQAVIIACGLTAVMIMAGSGIRLGHLTVGDFVLANTYLMQLYMPLNFFGTVYREIRQSLIDMETMFNLMDEPREVHDADDAAALEVSGGAIRFRDVAFGYGPKRTILKGVDFEVPAGNTLAIVGSSGAGKSTISRLLFRFYDVSGGAIEIDGQDIRTVTQESLRQSIGIVPQDTVLFNDTIYYNISYGRPSASPSEVEEAACMASIHDFIMTLPDGYQTQVGERGLKLSGGEKQRVAIARTILKQPRIFLFDEATSALDSKTEKAIQNSLAELSKGRTTLMIAHRLSTVVDADQILVLDEGRVAERGRHAELLEQGALYAAMWQRQQQSSELEHAPVASE